MKFEYLTPDEEAKHEKVMMMALGVLTPDNGEEYQPAVDDLAADIERYLKDDTDLDPNATVSLNLMRVLYGYCFVWASGYRWAKNPHPHPFAADVVVSPDERHYVNPTSVVVRFKESGDPGLKQLVLDVFDGNLPDCQPGSICEIGD